jgi:hypothetical protein
MEKRQRIHWKICHVTRKTMEKHLHFRRLVIVSLQNMSHFGTSQIGWDDNFFVNNRKSPCRVKTMENK